MILQEYLELGGVELLNNGRTRRYVMQAECGISALKGAVCSELEDAVGDYGTIEDAPWFDPALPASARFYGFEVISVSGLDDTRRQVSMIDGLIDGEIVTSRRKQGKEGRWKVALFAADREALEYGRAWLSAALDGTRCGDGADCDPVEARMLVDCPPGPSEFQMIVDGDDLRRNRAKTPQALAGSTWVSSAGTGGVKTDTFTTMDDVPVMQTEWTLAPTGGSVTLSFMDLSNAVDLIEGEELSGSLKIAKGGAAGPLRARFRITPFGSSAYYGPWFDLNTTMTTHSFVGSPVLPGETQGFVQLEVDSDQLQDNMWVAVGALMIGPGEYFDGDTARTNTRGYAWAGDENLSESVEVERVVVPDVATYERAVQALWRRMLDVVCTSGPVADDATEIKGGWMQEVEFVLASERPALYGLLSRLTDSMSSPPQHVEEEVFNLVPYPRGMAVTEFEWQRNYITNPSGESGAAGWRQMNSSGGGFVAANVDASEQLQGYRKGGFVIRASRTLTTGSPFVVLQYTFPAPPAGKYWMEMVVGLQHSAARTLEVSRPHLTDPGGAALYDYLEPLDSGALELCDDGISAPANTTLAGRFGALVDMPNVSGNIVLHVLSMYNGSGGTGRLFADGLALIPSERMLSYFDGDSSNAQWVGTPHASQSIRLADTPVGWSTDADHLIKVPGGVQVYIDGLHSFWVRISEGSASEPIVVAEEETPYSASIQVSSPQVDGATMRLRIRWVDASDGVISISDGPLVSMTGETVSLYASAEAPAGAVRAELEAWGNKDGGYFPVGSMITIHRAIMARGSTQQSFFDGDTSNTSESDYEWLGDRWESPSRRFPSVSAPVDPLLDPNCDPVPPPPSVPAIVDDCVSLPGEWSRRWVTIPSDMVTDGLTTLPHVYLYSASTPLNNIRLTVYENPQGLPANEFPAGDDWVSQQIVTFIPAGVAIRLDSLTETAIAELPAGVESADHLLYGPGGAPAGWPTLRCGVSYLIAVDVDYVGGVFPSVIVDGQVMYS